MKIAIARKDGDIVTIKDYSNVDGRGEVAHFLIELELMKLDLLDIWVDMKEDEKGMKAKE